MEKTKIEIKTEAEVIDDLRMSGYILKKSDPSDTSDAVQKAYKAGVESGRAQVLVEMMDDLRNDEKNGGNVWLLLESNNKDIGKQIITFLSWYLPKRYKDALGLK